MARKARKENPLISLAQPTSQKRIYHVGEYSRLSVEDSGKGTSDSIENQQAMIRDYVAAQPDMEFYADYCDNFLWNVAQSPCSFSIFHKSLFGNFTVISHKGNDGIFLFLVIDLNILYFMNYSHFAVMIKNAGRITHGNIFN